MSARFIFRRQLAYLLQRLRLPGALGLALLVGAVGYAFAVLLPANARNDQLERQLAAAVRQEQAAERDLADGTTTPAEQLMAFYRVFPKGTTIPDWLGKIYAIAEQQKLSLDSGEYSLTQEKLGRLDRFRIVFPVKGNYPQIRKFITAALSTAPALALDSVSMKREKVGESSVEARIVFLLYLEKER